MTSRRGVAKRRGWEERLRRHRTSGLTVTRFCANEGVSVKAFYYWARRVRTGSPRTTPVRPNSTAGQGAEQVSNAAAGTSSPAVVRFHFNAAVEVSVPRALRGCDPLPRGMRSAVTAGTFRCLS